MKLKIFLFILMTNATVLAQPGKKPVKPATEWDQLDESFIALIDALKNNDKAAFTALSLRYLDCIDCVGKPEFNKEGYIVTSDIFYLNIANNFAVSPVYEALAKRGYTFSTAVLKDFKPAVMPPDYPKDLKLYEVWVPTYLKNELSKDHPGSSHGFQFVKINGKFKFYGLTSIP